ncbi:MAG TPA: hypothetical protein VN578_25125 [Candidatus Binatia bacterium]|nr:hypothetical protein [Candidatus Binatia bacterium]
MRTLKRLPVLLIFSSVIWVPASQGAEVDFSKYDPACGVALRQEGGRLLAQWQAADGTPCAVEFSLKPNAPLLQSLEAGGKVLATQVQPVYLVTTGARVQRPGVKYIFFDKPSTEKNGPVKHFTVTLDLKSVRVESAGKRATITFSRLAAGPFAGELVFHLYAGSAFLQVEAALGLNEKGVAYIYDAVLDGKFKTLAWKDLQDQFVRVTPTGAAQPVAVRNRTIMSENENGTLAVFPAPHAFFFPRDYSINFKFAQAGEGRFGLRQDPAGGEGHEGQYVPWFDAPEGKVQRMSMFIYLSRQRAEGTLEEIKRYTHGDKFKPLEGCVTLASHMHSQLTVHENTSHPRAPDFKKVFKGMNVQAFQLAEFHGDGHPRDPGLVRLNELKGMFELCRKYSDEHFLLLPSEEANAYFPGHTVLLFPKPVYLTLVPIKGAPFSEDLAPYGTVYHPQDSEDLARLLKQESGLGWTSHPRIKGSEGCPDSYKDTDWYKDPLWLGATWKAMPGDLSEPRLGVRSLDLLDDMNTWGQRKVILGEVDCFTIDETHEIYGHMNVNYLHLAKLPGPDNWSPILDALRRGDSFVTTGEVLIHSCRLENGKVRADVEWTLPLGQAELVTGDGKRVQRKTLPLPDTKEFGRQTFEWPLGQEKAQWFRLEVWDIAYDGAFTQPKY